MPSRAENLRRFVSAAWGAYAGRKAIPGWVAIVWAIAVSLRGLIGLWSDAAFVAERWHGVAGLLLSPGFSLLSVIVGFGWLLAVGRPPTPPEPLVKKEPIAVEYAGVRWVHAGYYVGVGTPIAQAQCPRHKVRLFYKPHPWTEIHVREPREPAAEDLIDPMWGSLWCVDARGHSVNVKKGDAMSVRFRELESAAEALLEAKLKQA